MRITLLAGIAMATGLAACVVHDTPSVNPGYGGDGFGPRGLSGPSTAGEPAPAYVSGMPPEPLYEQMSDSPGEASVWIDGFWHWNGYEWVWVQGRWEREQQGYVYVEPNYDYVGDQYVYTPGYWSTPDRAPAGWNIRHGRDGRPTIVAPPVGSGGHRVPIASGTRHPDPNAIGRPIRGGARVPPNSPPLYDPRGGGRIPSTPQRDPNTGATWRPVRRPIGVFNPPASAPTATPTGAGGAIGGPGTAGGAIGRPGHGGTIFGGPPATSPPTAPPPPPVATPQPQPQPVWVPAPTGAIGRPTPPPMGRPIYVNPPGPAADQQRGPRQLGGPIFVHPAGPSAPPPPVHQAAPVAPPVRIAPPPPPPPPPAAPGPRSNNARRPQ